MSYVNHYIANGGVILPVFGRSRPTRMRSTWS